MHFYPFFSIVALASAGWLSVKPVKSPPCHHEPQPVHNACHIFNAIHSSMRQWGSSLNHNGMSFFLATVSEGVLLHHGTDNPKRVVGQEWLAFEPEHAMNFAYKICDNQTDTYNLTKARTSHQDSPNGSKLAVSTDRDIKSTDKSVPTDGDQALFDDKPPRPRRPPMCAEPGYLHTYTTTRPLHLLYIDGQSAAKSEKGTLDSQDYVLRFTGTDEPPSPPGPGFGDWRRAHDMCDLAKHDYEGKIDGFLRMEHGFEIMMCDFSVLDVVSIVEAQQESLENRFEPGDPSVGEHQFIFMSAVAARYDGIGGERVKINTEDFVTGFAHPGLDLWAKGEELPRLNGTCGKIRMRMKEDVKRMVLNEAFPNRRLGPGEKHPPPPHHERPHPPRHHGRPPPHPGQEYPPPPPPPPPHHAPPPPSHRKHHAPPLPINWQSIADQYVTRYAKMLLYLTSGKFDTNASLSDEIRRVYKPYLNRTHHDRLSEISRCTDAFIPTYLLHPHLPPHTQSLAQKTITTVAFDICETLYDAMDINSNSSTSHQDRIASIKSLISRLAWTEWKKCSPACGVVEVCYTAIWPFGSQADHDRPSCKNATALVGEDSMGYWFDGRRREPPPAKVDEEIMDVEEL